MGRRGCRDGVGHGREGGHRRWERRAHPEWGHRNKG